MQNAAIISLVLVGIAVGLFFAVIDPSYARIQELRVRDAELSRARENARSFQEDLENRRIAYETVLNVPEQGAKLMKLLPDVIDTTRLILTLEDIATDRDVSIFDVLVNEGSGSTPISTHVGVTRLAFRISGSYGDLFAFMRDLEQSVRLVDVEYWALTPPSDEVYRSSTDPNYTFDLEIATYWLRP